MSVHEKMTAIADAIREKTGKTDSLTLDRMATDIAGIETGAGANMISEVLSLTLAVDDTWATAEFTLASATSTNFSVPNPLGAVPTKIFILKNGGIDYTVTSQLIGGYNVGNIVSDSLDNRTLLLQSRKAGSQTIPNTMVREVTPSAWSFLTAAAGGPATAQTIYLRAGTESATLWPAGEYIIAVK